jgi:hypothetical protein
MLQFPKVSKECRFRIARTRKKLRFEANEEDEDEGVGVEGGSGK